MSEQILPPDILTLMDTIRRQAHEYTSAFSALETEQATLLKLREEIARELESFRSRGDFLLDSVRTSVNDTVTVIESKAKSVETIYNELDAIKALRDNLDKLKIVLEARDAELAAMIQSSKATVAKQVDQGVEKAQLRLDAMMEKAQSRIASFDQKLAALQDQQRRMFTILGDDVQALKDAQTRQELPLKNDLSRMKTEIELFKEELRERIDIIVSSGHRESVTSRKDHEPITEEKVRRDLDTHRKKTEQVQVQVQTMENRINIALGVALFAVSITIVSVIGVLFKWFR